MIAPASYVSRLTELTYTNVPRPAASVPANQLVNVMSSPVDVHLSGRYCGNITGTTTSRFLSAKSCFCPTPQCMGHDSRLVMFRIAEKAEERARTGE
jgi:hypothetical protein